ncbi:unnamed protein product [Ostreobium quekettii]|uniref:VWFA domain-containing protein n=1 Tax=Ostreobium quekettii TaxID=121088 RepID=A0A8S1J0I6_9CHLO|nr:unnamed protein product [Ostreobium quekettii]
MNADTCTRCSLLSRIAGGAARAQVSQRRPTSAPRLGWGWAWGCRKASQPDATVSAATADDSGRPGPVDPLRFLSSAGHRYVLGQNMLQQLSELPGTESMAELMVRANALAHWKHQLKKGVLPKVDGIEWPAEPFRSRFLSALQNIQMPTFTRRYPRLVDGLLTNMLDLVYEFEEKLLELQAEHEPPTPPPPMSPQGISGPGTGDEQQQERGQGGRQDGSEAGSRGPEEITDEMLHDAQDKQPSGEGADGELNNQQELEIEITSQELGGSDSNDGEGGDMDIEAELAAMAEDLVSEFEETMEPVMSNLNKLKLAFDGLDDLLDGSNGFSLNHSLWQRTGWHEFEQLRKKLERLRELREIVRSLGRSGGRGPIRKAPAQAEASSYPAGIVRSPLQPEETRGLSRSDDLSRMLPAEAALMAAGWPKREGGDGAEAREGSRAARLLHLARRAERSLLSYERTGWLEDVPARVLHCMELRPAAEQGPIIVCLDTSGSMIGGRETVAKAVVLECLRGAHRQRRACYLYAFSGPQDVKELELSVTVQSLDELLKFLEHSFHGGTDVDEPLKLSLERLQLKEWAQADILMVTDGEIPLPDDYILKQIEKAREEMGLEVHGLLVGDRHSPPMEALCSHLHVFRSWDAVKRPLQSHRT